MRKPVFWIGLLLLFNVSCEDPMEGDAVYRNPDASMNYSDFTYSPNPGDDTECGSDCTHWAFDFDTEGKADGFYVVDYHPDTGNAIKIEIQNEVVVDVWEDQMWLLPMLSASSQQATHSSELGIVTDPVPSKVRAAVLPAIEQTGGCNTLEKFCRFKHLSPSNCDTDDQIIYVQQPMNIGVNTPVIEPIIAQTQSQPRPTLTSQEGGGCHPVPGEITIYLPMS